MLWKGDRPRVLVTLQGSLSLFRAGGAAGKLPPAPRHFAPCARCAERCWEQRGTQSSGCCTPVPAVPQVLPRIVSLAVFPSPLPLLLCQPLRGGQEVTLLRAVSCSHAGHLLHAAGADTVMLSGSLRAKGCWSCEVWEAEQQSWSDDGSSILVVIQM